MVSPGVFIPLFENNALIYRLDSYVWAEAAAQIRDWRMRLGIFTLNSVEGETAGTEYEWSRAVEGTGIDGTITTQSDNNTFILKHGESIQIKFPPQKAIQITEENGVYTTSWATEDETVALSADNTAATITLTGNAEVTVTNTLEAVAPTGVRSVLWPCCLMLASGLFLLLPVIHRAQRRRKEQEPYMK